MGLDYPLCICFNIALLVVHKIVVVYRDSIYEMGPEMDSLTHSLEQLDTQVYCKLVILIFYMSIPPPKKFFILWILVQCRTIVHKEDLIFPVKVYLKGITSIKKNGRKMKKKFFSVSLESWENFVFAMYFSALELLYLSTCPHNALESHLKLIPGFDRM